MQADEETILNEVAAFIEAWNRADAQAAAAFCTEDCVRVGAFGDIQHGRAEVQAAYESLFQHTMPGARARQERGNVRMLTQEYAIWQGGLEIIAPDGSSRKGHVVQVMKKMDGRWLILEAHPKFFPPASGC
jgi:uncharacterized protein (TIGR02246 family)